MEISHLKGEECNEEKQGATEACHGASNQGNLAR